MVLSKIVPNVVVDKSKPERTSDPDEDLSDDGLATDVHPV